MTTLAAISGEALIHAVIWVLIAGGDLGLLQWAVSYIGVPEPFNKVVRVILAIVAVVFLINALLTLVGRPFITF